MPMLNNLIAQQECLALHLFKDTEHAQLLAPY